MLAAYFVRLSGRSRIFGRPFDANCSARLARYLADTISEIRTAAMLSLTNLLAKLVDTDRMTQMAERVAGRSRMGVWQRTMHQIQALGPTEARGYLRARGLSIVHEETLRLIEQEGTVVARHARDIEETAMQLLIDMISAQVAQSQAVGRRRAA
jgi:hypothetical protein